MSALGILGDVDITGVCNVFVSGVSATGEVSSVQVWSKIIPIPTPGYAPIVPSVVEDWSPIVTNQVSGYTPVTPPQSSGWSKIVPSQSPDWEDEAA